MWRLTCTKLKNHYTAISTVLDRFELFSSTVAVTIFITTLL